MHLSYRGLPYQPSTSTVPAPESPLFAQYRGMSYSLPSELEISASAVVTLQYRGVCYFLNSEAGQPESVGESLRLQLALA